jgi:hypothetical protein
MKAGPFISSDKFKRENIIYMKIERNNGEIKIWRSTCRVRAKGERLACF